MKRIIFAALLLAVPAHAAERSSKVRRQFQALHPCPSTGATKGACPGYVADHVVPRCANGPDTIANLRWESVEDARAKDRVEVALCAALRRSAALKASCAGGAK